MKASWFLGVMLVGCASSPGLVLDPDPDPNGVSGSANYIGNFVVSGEYHANELDELYLVLEGANARGLPFSDSAPAVVHIEEAGQDILRKLAGTHSVPAVDGSRICGVSGSATVELSGLQTAPAESGRWYRSRVTRVIASKQPHAVGCRSGR